jgi:hypothetical protein
VVMFQWAGVLSSVSMRGSGKRSDELFISNPFRNSRGLAIVARRRVIGASAVGAHALARCAGPTGRWSLFGRRWSAPWLSLRIATTESIETIILPVIARIPISKATTRGGSSGTLHRQVYRRIQVFLKQKVFQKYGMIDQAKNILL